MLFLMLSKSNIKNPYFLHVVLLIKNAVIPIYICTKGPNNNPNQ